MKHDTQYATRNTLFTVLLGLGLVLALGGGIVMARQAQAQEPGPRGPLGSQAALGTGFTYQGRLIQNGSPVSDTCEFRFALYDDASVGSQVGVTQTKPSVPVSDGYFTVSDLDFGSSAFTGDARWLAIAVDCGSGSTTLSPRVPLTAAPYAHGLRPGARVDGSATGTILGDAVLNVHNSDTSAGRTAIFGVSGSAASGYPNEEAGVRGEAASGYGVVGRSTSNYGVFGSSSSAHGVYGTSSSGHGVLGYSTGSGYGVYGTSNSGYGVYAYGGAGDLQLSGTGTIHANESGDSDLELHSNDNVDVHLDDDGNSASQFRILNGADAVVFSVDESGVISGSVSGSGDITAVYAGDGLSGGGETGAVTLTVATTYRLPQSCGNGQVAKWNPGAGQWECGNDQTGAGGDFWSLSGNGGTTPGTDFLGTTDNQALQLHVNGVRALRLEPNGTSPNLVGGYSGNSASAGVVGASIGGGGRSGAPNQVTADYATIGGGGANIAGGVDATVGGGWYNTASNNNATVGGGGANIAGGASATIGGGWKNTASDYATTIGGGEFINVTGQAATVAGGSHITATGDYAAVGGGEHNVVTATHATVGGGNKNTASGNGATVGGGSGNFADNEATTVGGGESNFAGGIAATVGGGVFNVASGDFATVPGGYSADASHFGEMAHASGGFLMPGDAQGSFYVLRGTTYDDIPAELFLDGVSERLTLATDRVVTFDILVVARSTSGDSAGYNVQGVVENWGGATAFVGVPVVTTLGEIDAAWDVAVVADDANDALVILVTGAAAEETRWVATVRTAEVSWTAVAR